jgi:hypothetical protein
VDELSEVEKRFVALALQGVAMRTGPESFKIVDSVAQKLEIWPQLEFYLRDWLGLAQNDEERSALKRWIQRELDK